MSAINLYTTKAQAFYYKDSQRNKFYEFGGIQLLPNSTYTQEANVIGLELFLPETLNICNAYDDTVIQTIPYTIAEKPSTNTVYADSTVYKADNITLKIDDLQSGVMYWTITPTIDCGINLVYLKFTGRPISDAMLDNFKTRVLADSGIIEADSCLNALLLSLIDLNDYPYFYSNPFYITATDEDLCTQFSYKNLPIEKTQSIGLKTWFRQKSRQTELTTYYESSTKNTVTQAIKTHNLELHESEFMSIDDLILTASILESSYLYIGTTRYSLFEAIKIPELTQRENFGKLKFILAPNN